MSLYTYRIEAYDLHEDTWSLVEDGTTHSAGADDADQVALDTQYTWTGRMHSQGRLHSDHPGHHRVRVWADGNDGEPDGVASTWIARERNTGGRPREGQVVNVRLPEDLVTTLDERAKSAGESRAEIMRRILTDALT